jgi:transcription elongation factor GreA
MRRRTAICPRTPSTRTPRTSRLIGDERSNEHVQIGSTVIVEGANGRETYTIVGSTEASPRERRISNESPVGRALLGKRTGDRVVVRVPAGDFTYQIVEIS